MNTTMFGPVKIYFFGHSSVCLEYNNLTFYVDPYVVPKNAKRADVILHTHSHFDHCVVPSSIETSSTTIISHKGKFPGREVEIGEKITVRGVQIEVVHAYNVNKSFHPKEFGAGYIFSFPTSQAPVRIYVAGDTDLIPEMKNYKCDVAIIPIGGTYTMNADEAAQALVQLKPRVAIPYHYNYLSDTQVDPQGFVRLARTLAPATEVRILTP
ncbi:MAG: MBL fold metallo-hydrolase [Candidatus Micrarchaeia archaeon]